MDNTKKNILIIMNNLRVGGAEKALISLLQTFDYSLYNVDLLLFKKEGLFINQIPKEVILLVEPPEYKFFDMAFSKAILNAFKLRRLDIVFNRIKMAYLFKTEKNGAIREQKLWKYLGKCLQPISKKYDLAIGFLEKTPNYFCVDKTTAKVKIGWIHTSYSNLKMNSKFDLKYFEKLNKIITISKTCAVDLENIFPMFLNKILIFENIIPSNLIEKLSNDEVDFKTKSNTLLLVTVSRLSYEKGCDLAIESCKILKKQNVNFIWIFIGEGNQRKYLQDKITEYNLENHAVLLGLKENPYPYVKLANFYIQPSRYEGKSISIDEAKILKKPIIVTNFSTAKDQINSGENGLIVAMNPEAIAIEILNLQNNLELQNKLVFNLSNEKMGNESEIEKIYALIN